MPPKRWHAYKPKQVEVYRRFKDDLKFKDVLKYTYAYKDGVECRVNYKLLHFFYILFLKASVSLTADCNISTCFASCKKTADKGSADTFFNVHNNGNYPYLYKRGTWYRTRYWVRP